MVYIPQKKTEINALQLEKTPDSVISYKDKYAKISKDVCKDKYSCYKHMRQEDTILFRHERAEIYLKYDSCQEIWFLKEMCMIQTISQQCLAYIVYPNRDHFNVIISTIWSSSTSITNTKKIYYNTAAAFLTDNDTDFYDSGKVWYWTGVFALKRHRNSNGRSYLHIWYEKELLLEKEDELLFLFSSNYLAHNRETI